MSEKVFSFSEEEVAEMLRSGQMKLSLSPSHDSEPELVQGEDAEKLEREALKLYGPQSSNLVEADRKILLEVSDKIMIMINTMVKYEINAFHGHFPPRGVYTDFIKNYNALVSETLAKLSSDEARDTFRFGLSYQTQWLRQKQL